MSSSSRPGKARRLWREKVGDGRRGGEEEEGGGQDHESAIWGAKRRRRRLPAGQSETWVRVSFSLSDLSVRQEWQCPGVCEQDRPGLMDVVMGFSRQEKGIRKETKSEKESKQEEITRARTW